MNNIENEIISAFYLNSENLHQAIEFGVSSTWFRNEQISDIYSFMVELSKAKEWNQNTAANVFIGAGGFDKFPEILEICSIIPDWAFNLEEINDAFEVLRGNHAVDKLRNASLDISTLTSNGSDPFDVATKVITDLEELENLGCSDERTNAQIATDVIDLDRKIMAGEPVGLPFPWRKLQKETNGVPFSAVSPLAGRDGKGKSRLATWLGVHWACSGFPGMTFPFEDTEIRCLRNMACALGEYDAFKLSQPYLPDNFKEMHEEAVHRASKLPMYICDYAHRIEQIVSQIATHKRKYGIRWAIIDGFKDIASSGGENRTQEEVKIMRALTACARKYKVAIIPVMHINKIEDDRWISKQFITGSGDQTKSARMTMIYQDHIPADMKDNIAPDCYDDNLFALDAQKTSYGTPTVMPLIKCLEKGRFEEYEPLTNEGEV